MLLILFLYTGVDVMTDTDKIKVIVLIGFFPTLKNLTTLFL